MSADTSHPPRALALSYCAQCGATFILTPEDTHLLPTMYLRPPGGREMAPESMRLWAHWIEHIASHCANCRLPKPPMRCLKDLERHQKLAR